MDYKSGNRGQVGRDDWIEYTSSATPTAPKQQTAWQRAVNAISIDGVVDFTSLMQEIQPYVNRLPTIKKLMIYKKVLEMVQQEYVNEVKKQCPNTRTDRP